MIPNLIVVAILEMGSLLLMGALWYATLGHPYTGSRSHVPITLGTLGILLTAPLIPDNIAVQVPWLDPAFGTARLLVQIGVVTAALCHYRVMAVINRRSESTQRWIIIGGLALLVLFVICWALTHRVHTANPVTLYYGERAGRPTIVWLMYLALAAGLCYSVAWAGYEYSYRAIHSIDQLSRRLAMIGALATVALLIVGLLTALESTLRHFGETDYTRQMYAAKLPIIVLSFGLAAIVLNVQVFIRPLWMDHKRILAAYVAPEVARRQQAMVEVLSFCLEQTADIHNDDYKNRAILNHLKDRCERLHLSEWDRKVALNATGWLTLNRDNALQQPFYVDADRFSDLPGDEQARINDRLQATALSYVERKVEFLSEVMQAGAYVLGHGKGFGKDARARQLYDIAVLCATTMADHGELTPLAQQLENQTHRSHDTSQIAVVS
ncbi:MAG TPA: hypothetical protein VNL35_16805 [Chloroflexota bacterium]|nr:hypothetical protein [Chloroflexota bacterium]